ncbi:MAG: FmdB family transcriptional regulator [Nitriliruptor sp.]|nr:MAG: FmdB family transcriptional regulator [Nitriliruptor sp.]
MPTYEYACRSCGEHLEVVQSFRDDPLTDCPACQGQLRKVFSAAGIIFKGSGWHVKDYASSSKSGSGSSGSSSSSDTSSSPKGDGDTGVASKSDGASKDSSSSKGSSSTTSATSEAASA